MTVACIVSEIRRRSGVSMPSLLKYKRLGLFDKYRVGDGRTAKYKARDDSKDRDATPENPIHAIFPNRPFGPFSEFNPFAGLNRRMEFYFNDFGRPVDPPPHRLHRHRRLRPIRPRTPRHRHRRLPKDPPPAPATPFDLLVDALTKAAAGGGRSRRGAEEECKCEP